MNQASHSLIRTIVKNYCGGIFSGFLYGLNKYNGHECEEQLRISFLKPSSRWSLVQPMHDAHMASIALFRLGARAKKRSTRLWLRIRVASWIKWWLARWLWLIVGMIFFMSTTYANAGLTERDSKMRWSSHALTSDSTQPLALPLGVSFIGAGNCPLLTNWWTWERHNPVFRLTSGQRMMRANAGGNVLLFCFEWMLLAMFASP